MDKTEIQKTMEMLSELRKEVKEVHPAVEKIEKLNKLLDVQEETNQATTKALELAKSDVADFKERMDTLEKELARSENANANINHKEKPEYKALSAFITKGEAGLRDIEVEEQKALRTDIMTSGGYLTMSEMDTSIIKKIIEVSAIRSIARVRSISGKSIEMPGRATIPVATFEGQAATGSESESTYNNRTVTPIRQTITTPITREQLMDSAFDMESEIFSDSSIAFALGEGIAHVTGSGVKGPEGLLINPEVVANAFTSTVSGAFSAADIFNLQGTLKVGYDASLVFTRQTLAFMRTLAGSNGQFLLAPGLNGGAANEIAGSPYLLAQAMPNIASNALAIAYGDFRMGYSIVDRTGTTVIRDELSGKKEAIVEFTMHRWTTGQVVLPEAIRVLKCLA